MADFVPDNHISSIEVGDNLQFRLNTRSIKSAIKSKTGELITMSKNPSLQYRIMRLYADIVTPYVPRSNLPSSRHHLQSYKIKGNQIIWHRENSAGEPIADMLYEGRVRGRWHKRVAGGNEFGSHKPRSEWATAMEQSGNQAKFHKHLVKLVKEYIDTNGINR